MSKEHLTITQKVTDMQADYNLANQNGAQFRQELNDILQAIATTNSGASEPETKYSFQLWADTSSGYLKQRNSANDAWVVLGSIGVEYLGLLSPAGGNLTGAINGAKTTVASASSIDIWSGADFIDLTGAATVTGFSAAPQAGAKRILRLAGAASFTAGANVIINGVSSGNTYAGSANDLILVIADTATLFRLVIFKADGSPVSFNFADASETVKGIMEIATAAETRAGTDTDKAIPPSALAATVIGMGQTWQNLTGSRAASTNYTNSTGRPIQVCVYSVGTGGQMDLIVSGVTVSSNNPDSAAGSTATAIVPAGAVYSFNGSFSSWTELR